MLRNKEKSIENQEAINKRVPLAGDGTVIDFQSRFHVTMKKKMTSTTKVFFSLICAVLASPSFSSIVDNRWYFVSSPLRDDSLCLSFSTFSQHQRATPVSRKTSPIQVSYNSLDQVLSIQPLSFEAYFEKDCWFACCCRCCVCGRFRCGDVDNKCTTLFITCSMLTIRGAFNNDPPLLVLSGMFLADVRISSTSTFMNNDHQQHQLDLAVKRIFKRK